MNQTFSEVVILAIAALGTGFLVFIARVVQKVMETMDELEFKRFLTTLDRYAEKSIYTIAVSTVPLLAGIVYLVVFGLNHWWFVGGLAVWTGASVASKLLNLPIYKWIEDEKNTNVTQIRRKRQDLRKANNIRAALNVIAVVLMTLQFFSL